MGCFFGTDAIYWNQEATPNNNNTNVQEAKYYEIRTYL